MVKLPINAVYFHLTKTLLLRTFEMQLIAWCLHLEFFYSSLSLTVALSAIDSILYLKPFKEKAYFQNYHFYLTDRIVTIFSHY